MKPKEKFENPIKPKQSEPMKLEDKNSEHYTMLGNLFNFLKKHNKK